MRQKIEAIGCKIVKRGKNPVIKFKRKAELRNGIYPHYVTLQYIVFSDKDLNTQIKKIEKDIQYWLQIEAYYRQLEAKSIPKNKSTKG